MSLGFDRDESLDAFIPGVCNVDGPLSVDGNADRFIELTGIESGGAKIGDEIAVRVEDGNPLVSSVCDVNPSLGINCQSARAVEGIGCFTLTKR